MDDHQQVEETDKLNQPKQQLQDSDESDDDLDSGWAWVVLFASFGTCFLIGSSVYASGITHSTLLERYRESASVTSWAGALQSSLFSLAGPLSSLLSDRYSCRTAIVLSGVFFFFGYTGTAFAPNIELAIITSGVLTGIGAGIGYTAALVVVGLNFKRKRNLALGIAVAGIGAGIFVLAPLMQMTRDYYGPVGFFLILASVTSHIIIFGVLCFPSKLEILTQKERRLDSLRSGQSCFAVLRPYSKVLCNKAMICLFVCMFCFCLGSYLMYLFLPSYIVSMGFSAMQAAFLVSLSGVVSVFGRLLTGLLANSNRINEIILYSGSMTIVGLASLIYPFISNYFAGHVIYVIILGLFFGSCYVTVIAVSLKFVAIKNLAPALGLQFFFGGFGAFAGPFSAGLLYDALDSYEVSILVAAAFIIVGSGFGMATMCCKQITNEIQLKSDCWEEKTIKE